MYHLLDVAARALLLQLEDAATQQALEHIGLHQNDLDAFQCAVDMLPHVVVVFELTTIAGYSITAFMHSQRIIFAYIVVEQQAR